MAKPWWPLEICGSISWFCPFGVAVSCLPWACQSMMMKIVVLKKFHWPPLSALQHLIWSLCWKETNTVVESCQTYRKKKNIASLVTEAFDMRRMMSSSTMGSSGASSITPPRLSSPAPPASAKSSGPPATTANAAPMNAGSKTGWGIGQHWSIIVYHSKPWFCFILESIMYKRLQKFGNIQVRHVLPI